MQLKDQATKSRDWKVVAALATLSALGVSGLALADSGDTATPDSIDLRDRTEIAQVTAQNTGGDFPAVVLSADSPNDSPFDDVQSLATVTTDSPASPASADSPASVPTAEDSPASPATADSPADGDSPDSVDNSADS